MFGRRAKARGFLRWLCYGLLLLLFYTVMVGGFFRYWQPVLILPLAVAVAMREGELASGIFGAMCGFALDMAGTNLFGMSAVWLLPGCAAVSLLVTHLVRVNVVNHLWMSTVLCFILAFMEYIFKYFIWQVPGSAYILTGYIIPSYASAAVFSPVVYALAGLVNARFGQARENLSAEPGGAPEENTDSEKQNKSRK